MARDLDIPADLLALGPRFVVEWSYWQEDWEQSKGRFKQGKNKQETNMRFTQHTFGKHRVYVKKCAKGAHNSPLNYE